MSERAHQERLRHQLSQKKAQRAEQALTVAPKAELGPLTWEQKERLTKEQLSCPAKLAFRSRAATVKWIRAHPPGWNMQKVVPYQCPRCEQWHTTKAQR